MEQRKRGPFLRGSADLSWVPLMGLLSLLALPKHPQSPGLDEVGVLDGVVGALDGVIGVLDGVVEAVSVVWGAV